MNTIARPDLRPLLIEDSAAAIMLTRAQLNHADEHLADNPFRDQVLVARRLTRGSLYAFPNSKDQNQLLIVRNVDLREALYMELALTRERRSPKIYGDDLFRLVMTDDISATLAFSTPWYSPNRTDMWRLSFSPDLNPLGVQRLPTYSLTMIRPDSNVAIELSKMEDK